MNTTSLFCCLGEETRFSILSALTSGDPQCVGDLVELTGKEQTNVSHHLAQLRACGLVVTERRGREVHYSLAHPRLATFLDEAQWLAEHIECTEPEACAAAGCC